MHLNNNVSKDSQEIVNSFSNYFFSVYTQSQLNRSINFDSLNTSVSLSNIDIYLFDVLETLNLNFNNRPDNIHSKFTNAVSFCHHPYILFLNNH